MRKRACMPPWPPSGPGYCAMLFEFGQRGAPRVRGRVWRRPWGRATKLGQREGETRVSLARTAPTRRRQEIDFGRPDELAESKAHPAAPTCAQPLVLRVQQLGPPIRPALAGRRRLQGCRAGDARRLIDAGDLSSAKAGAPVWRRRGRDSSLGRHQRCQGSTGPARMSANRPTRRAAGEIFQFPAN